MVHLRVCGPGGRVLVLRVLPGWPSTPTPLPQAGEGLKRRDRSCWSAGFDKTVRADRSGKGASDARPPDSTKLPEQLVRSPLPLAGEGQGEGRPKPGLRPSVRTQPARRFFASAET